MIINPSIVMLCLITLVKPPSISTEGDDGHRMPGLRGEVTIEVDGRGIPTIRAMDGRDAHAGLGWMHGRERFFQMDMTRRKAAGELAALAGPALLDQDRDPAMARRREQAERIANMLPADEKSILEAYARGVNAGVGSLAEPPVEYGILKAEPRPWSPADSILVVLSMFDQLQRSADQEPAVHDLRGFVGGRVADWMLSVPGRWDSLLIAPDASESTPAYPPDLDRAGARFDPTTPRRIVTAMRHPVEIQPGSNSFAVAGSRTADGRAIVANDPHLATFAPGIWYRVALRWPGVAADGISLPGTPGLPVGTTEFITWGLTNTTGDFEDLVVVEVDPDDNSRYRVDGGHEPFDDRIVTIEVAGGPDVEIRSRFTRWGPVLSALPDGRPLALLRACDQAGAVNFGIVGLLEAESLETGLDVASAWGGPSQNVLVADHQGRIGWTLSGFIPDRQGYDGLSPVTHLDGRGWFGMLPEIERPRVMDPSSGAIVTANNRLLPLPAADRIGRVWADGGRAWRIRAELDGRPVMTEWQLLSVQLDETIQRFIPYRDLLIDSLGGLESTLPGRDATLDLVVGWDGRASANDTATPVVEMFRRTLQAEVRAMLLERFAPSADAIEAEEITARSNAASAIRSSTVLAAIEGRDPRILSPDGWRAILEQGARTAVEIHLADPDTPWAERNRSRSPHPLGMAHPLVGDRFDLPAVRQPGHWGAVRVQSRGFGASARFVASPGHLGDAILATPGGQSGRPRSPHYSDLHASWSEGAPEPLAPGPVRSTWTISPVAADSDEADASRP